MNPHGDREHGRTVDDPSEEIPIETPEADAAEQRRSAREGGSDSSPDLSAEAEVDPADAAEQNRTAREEDEEWPDTVPMEADPADTFEQRRTIELDEDDYR
ncbi:hypothetical protein ACFQVD_38635 [Streptosporangium amethystogenes subsp. fukuiense]|uniref:Uncharacterized protein n=1 Tax=Streptosporangium amethystogenes subsp. fukuiense TaxID=698418 RepID=A0ABW2TCS0_9ACTN